MALPVVPLVIAAAIGALALSKKNSGGAHASPSPSPSPPSSGPSSAPGVETPHPIPALSAWSGTYPDGSPQPAADLPDTEIPWRLDNDPISLVVDANLDIKNNGTGPTYSNGTPTDAARMIAKARALLASPQPQQYALPDACFSAGFRDYWYPTIQGDSPGVLLVDQRTADGAPLLDAAIGAGDRGSILYALAYDHDTANLLRWVNWLRAKGWTSAMKLFGARIVVLEHLRELAGLPVESIVVPSDAIPSGLAGGVPSSSPLGHWPVLAGSSSSSSSSGSSSGSGGAPQGQPTGASDGQYAGGDDTGSTQPVQGPANVFTRAAMPMHSAHADATHTVITGSALQHFQVGQLGPRRVGTYNLGHK